MHLSDPKNLHVKEKFACLCIIFAKNLHATKYVELGKSCSLNFNLLNFAPKWPNKFAPEGKICTPKSYLCQKFACHILTSA